MKLLQSFPSLNCKMASFTLSTYYIFLLTFFVTPKIINSQRKALRLWKHPSIYAKSIPDMESLENLDLQIVQSFSQALQENSGKLLQNQKTSKLVESYLRDYYESNGFTATDNHVRGKERKMLVISQNPICAYRLLRRANYFLTDLIQQKDFALHFETLRRRIKYQFLSFGIPRHPDVETYAEKILRIQKYYGLKPEELANGTVWGVNTNCKLNSMNCYEISRVATITEQFAFAIQWLELAKEKSIVDNMTSGPQIEFSLWKAIEEHNEDFMEDHKLFLEPVFFDRKISHVPGDSKNVKTLLDLHYKRYKGKTKNVIINYLAVCSGENLQSEDERAVLFCWYEYKIHWSFAIGPVKMEFLSRSPDIVQMYEILNEGDIEKMLRDCGPGMEAPTDFDMVGYQSAPSKAKTSPTSFHQSYAFHNCLPSQRRELEGKLERLTGLEINGSASDVLRLLSYSPGGHIHPHLDRLSDVELGGGTAFTTVGVNAQPIKGSAVLWFSFRTDGTEDKETLHSGCPVVLGKKWGVNKWVRYGSQFLKLPCGLNPNERVRFPVNDRR